MAQEGSGDPPLQGKGRRSVCHDPKYCPRHCRVYCGEKLTKKLLVLEFRDVGDRSGSDGQADLRGDGARVLPEGASSLEMPCPGESPELSGVYRQTAQQLQRPGSCPECYTNQTFVFDDGSSSQSLLVRGSGFELTVVRSLQRAPSLPWFRGSGGLGVPAEQSKRSGKPCNLISSRPESPFPSCLILPVPCLSPTYRPPQGWTLVQAIMRWAASTDCAVN
ncbi:hypothetical protein lerEdw1_006766 [Lerista edwardsae]|nr:hypothetical protein lerEdw1_006766 [Lerista edwardsae]